MKYLQLYEKFGIKKSLDEQVDSYFETIQNNPKQTKFDFNYVVKDSPSSWRKVFNFKVLIKKINSNGVFSQTVSNNLVDHGDYSVQNRVVNYEISLNDRNNKEVLRHEVKHLDYAIHKPFFMNSLFAKANNKLSNIKSMDDLKFIANTFYLLDINEFESRYVEYYHGFDNYLSNKTINSPSDIFNYFLNFLNNNEDYAWCFYTSNKHFKFENSLSKRDINRLFHFFLSNKDYYKHEYDNMFMWIYTDIKKAFKKVLNSYTKEELEEIERLKIKYEKEINKVIPIRRKKFFRIITAMVEKYCK